MFPVRRMWKGTSEVRNELFGGRGEVSVTSVIAAPPPPFDCALGCVLSPGGSVGPHVQSDCAEIVVVFLGTGAATVSGAMHPLRPGAMVSVPLGATLSLEADDAEPLYYAIIKARAATPGA